jgi:hypothetical protein
LSFSIDAIFPQNIEILVGVVESSNALVPASELPLAFKPGDQTQMLNSLGITAKMPPPTPLFSGKPTR